MADTKGSAYDAEEASIMKAIKVDQIGDAFTDDHILCVKVNITWEDGTKEEKELDWCGWEICAAVLYANESKKAMKNLNDYITQTKEDGLWEEDEL